MNKIKNCNYIVIKIKPESDIKGFITLEKQDIGSSSVLRQFC